MSTDRDMPAYAYVPGGPWPHPNRPAAGAPRAPGPAPPPPIDPDDWGGSPTYLLGFRLFDAGYYWEAHEVWESLWHAHGRRGPEADVLKALIKLAAAGVKVREGQPGGVTTHAARAEALFLGVRDTAGADFLGLDLGGCARLARETADRPPADPAPPGARVSRVFGFRLTPGP